VIGTSRAQDARPKAPRVIAVASHPIQYQAPWFRGLAQETAIDFSALFVQLPDSHQQGQGFGRPFEWDVPILEGYRWQQVPDVRGGRGLKGFFSARIRGPLALLRKLRPDLILLTGWHSWSLLQVLFAAWWAGIPVIMRGESNALRDRPWLTRTLHRVLLRRCAAFLSIGRANREFYHNYGIGDMRLFDAPYFVDNARFAESAAQYHPQRAKLRERWAIRPDAVCFCYAGKLEPKKRILDVLAALRAAAAQSEKPLHLLVVGTGELLPQAHAYVIRHCLPVTFAGFLNQTKIPGAYIASDCLVLASDYGETWGLVVNEAMACGRPAIVSDRVGSGPDLVKDHLTGLIFPFGDVASLAAHMVELAADTERMKRMGEAALARVLAEYSVAKAVSGTLQAVHYVLAAR
jgi:glycosyltransferase involved in cell wall biosynthesis